MRGQGGAASVPRVALVTGATGYIGQALVCALLDAGAEVHAVVRPGSDRGRLARLARPPRWHAHDGATDTLARAVEAARPDVAFHLAAHYRRDHGSGDVVPLVDANVRLGAQLLEALRLAGGGRLVATRSHFERCGDDGDGALNLYAATKRAFIELLRWYVEATPLSAVTLTLYEVYGPGDWRRRLVPAIAAAQAEARPLPLPERPDLLDLVHVDDVVAALLRAAELTAAPGAAGRVTDWAVSSGTLVSAADVVAAYERASGAPVPVAPGAWPAPARAITRPWRGPTLPGWAPSLDLDAGLARVVAADRALLLAPAARPGIVDA